MALSTIVTSTPYINKATWGDPITDRVHLLSAPPVAIVRRTTAQSLPNNTFTAITWTSVVVDTAGMAAASATPFVLPDTGTYLVFFAGSFVANGTGVRFAEVTLAGTPLLSYTGWNTLAANVPGP